VNVYVQAFEGDRAAPSFVVSFEEHLLHMTDGVIVNAIGHLAAREQEGWNDDRIASARWEVVRVPQS